jgi:hypothetical protein
MELLRQAINSTSFVAGVGLVLVAWAAFLIWNRSYRPYGRPFPRLGVPTIPLVMLLLAWAYLAMWLHKALNATPG